MSMREDDNEARPVWFWVSLGVVVITACAVILISAYGEVQNGLQAVKSGQLNGAAENFILNLAGPGMNVTLTAKENPDFFHSGVPVYSLYGSSGNLISANFEMKGISLPYKCNVIRFGAQMGNMFLTVEPCKTP